MERHYNKNWNEKYETIKISLHSIKFITPPPPGTQGVQATPHEEKCGGLKNDTRLNYPILHGSC